MPGIFPELGAAQVNPHQAPSGVAAGVGAGQNLLGGLETGYGLGQGLGQGISNVGASLFGEESVFGVGRARDINRTKELQQSQTEEEKKRVEFINKLEVMRPMDTFNHMMKNKPEWVDEKTWRDMQLAGLRQWATNEKLVTAKTKALDASTFLKSIEARVAKGVADGTIKGANAENALKTIRALNLTELAPAEKGALREELGARTEAAKTAAVLDRETRDGRLKAAIAKYGAEETSSLAMTEVNELNKEFARVRFEMQTSLLEGQLDLTAAQTTKLGEDTRLAERELDISSKRLYSQIAQAEAGLKARATEVYAQAAQTAVSQYSQAIVEAKGWEETTMIQMATIKKDDSLTEAQRTAALSTAQQFLDGIRARTKEARDTVKAQLDMAVTAAVNLSEIKVGYGQYDLSRLAAPSGSDEVEEKADKVEDLIR